MNSVYCVILLLIPLASAYPPPHGNDYDRFIDMYVRERAANMDKGNQPNSNEERIVRRQNLFLPLPVQQHPSQGQAMCVPNIWTCGPNLPPCCPGLMCYDGNAKRGRHCVARG